MSRTFFASELEGVATYWRIYRTDGCTLGFVSHDRDLVSDDILHRAAPGILPASLRKTDTLSGDSAEMRGPLGHWSIAEADLEQGRFDHATVEVGALDWETGEALALFSGTLGAVSRDGGTFVAELQSAKAMLDVDPVPRTSPSCRARFCGEGCTLSAARFTHRASHASGRGEGHGPDRHRCPAAVRAWRTAMAVRRRCRPEDTDPVDRRWLDSPARDNSRRPARNRHARDPSRRMRP